MKKLIRLAVAFAALAFTACQEKEEASKPMEMSVEPFTDVHVAGNFKVEFVKANTQKNIRVSATHYVKIYSSHEQRDHITINSIDGILRISSDNHIQLADSVVVKITSANINEVRLKRNQQSIFNGLFNQSELKIVAEEKSQLSLFNLKVDHLVCKAEDNSSIILATFQNHINGVQSYEIERGVALNDSTLIVDDAFMLVGDSVGADQNGEFWIVYGDVTHSSFKMQQCDFMTQGRTRIDASKALSEVVNINLEGSSQASVYATKSINGNGEGTSVLYYNDLESLNTADFSTLGDAQLTAWN
ncbi:DUF2807 domain-containing protein [Marinoscillum sp. MHG1-6]|uniref:DUF2807 domain-containing protein n=1 Tax=Marinoscillum sp. MHG1-6 TaxID=2959627 RepID=UPI002157EA35|nr:DUF2807 domain-containing protein [Marinoscillum sp. MHG1-6]